MHEARRRLAEAMAPTHVARKRRGLSAELARILAEHGLPFFAPKPN
jgi:hypothetical protein